MTQTTYQVWFEPAENGSKQSVPGESYHERAVAETVAEHFNSCNNPAWNGMFVVVEHFDGNPNSITNRSDNV